MRRGQQSLDSPFSGSMLFFRSVVVPQEVPFLRLFSSLKNKFKIEAVPAKRRDLESFRERGFSWMLHRKSVETPPNLVILGGSLVDTRLWL